MWDFTRSMFRFSWAMSVFGAQQMANLLQPSKAAKAFEDVTQATEAELGGVFKQTFRAGDVLQRNLVDMTLGGQGGAARRTAQPSGVQTGQRTQPVPAQARHTPGWGPMPRGPATTTTQSPPQGGTSFAEPDISPDYPFEPHYVDVLGSKMHYITAGSGDPILLLHGNPTWSYIWRNIIPHLSPLGRCIAPDLIGFGRSDKPQIEYTWSDHSRYLHEFIEAMDLRNVTLVLHDQGSGLGLHWAMRHQHRVKAIAFFEALIRPFTWENFSTPEFRELFQAFRSGGVGGQGWQMIVEQNMFIEQLLPQAAGRPLSEREMDFYREPFRTRESRIPVWRFPRQTAIGGEPRDVWETVSDYSEKLQRSDIPKLMLYATPGALLTAEHVQWAQSNIRNLRSVDIGPGSHFLQESSPNRIGREIAAWCRSLPGFRDQGSGGSNGDQADPIGGLRNQILQMLDSLEPGTPIAAIVIFKADPSKEDRFRQAADDLTEATRRLPGCNVFAFHKATQTQAGQPIEYLIYEDWQTREQFRVQWTSGHIRRFQEVVGDLVVAQPDLRFYLGWREYRRGGAR